MSPKSLPIPTVQPHSVLKVSQNDRFTSFSPKIQGWHMVHPYYLSGLRLSDTKGTLCPPPPPPPLLGTAPQGQQYSHLEGGGGQQFLGGFAMILGSWPLSEGVCGGFTTFWGCLPTCGAFCNLIGCIATLQGSLQPCRMLCNLVGCLQPFRVFATILTVYKNFRAF